MNTLSLLVSPVGLAALPTVTKSVGSFFRYNVDYRNAPEEDRKNEFKREISLLSLAFASNFAVQLLASRNLPKVLKALVPSVAKDPATMQAASLLARFALTIPGTVIAESLSRVIGKPPSWDSGSQEKTKASVENDDDHPAEAEVKPAPFFVNTSAFNTPPAVFNPFVTTSVPMAGTPAPPPAPVLTSPFLGYHAGQTANTFTPRNFQPQPFNS